MNTNEIQLILKQLEMSLPTYTDIFKNITVIRKNAIEYKKNLSDSLKEEYEQYAYNNIISILGERGSGKSTLFRRLRYFFSGSKASELNDFKEKLRQDLYNRNDEDDLYEKEKLARNIQHIQDAYRECDINLRLIVPEMLEEGIDVLGMILLNIKDYMDKNKGVINAYYETSYYNNRGGGFNGCIGGQQTPLEEQWQATFKLYVQRDEAFNSILKENYSSLMDYTSSKKHFLMSEVFLESKLFDLFTELTNVFGGQNGGSLLYIYMDDVDINRKRCGEAIRTVLRYLKHPNVVVFLSGDLEKFQEELTNDELILQQAGEVSDIIDRGHLREQAQNYVYELMKKVMPYANRYQLVKFSNEEKIGFLYNQIGVENKMTFGEMFDEKVLGGQCELPVWAYSVFDEKPRGLATIFEYIYHGDFTNKDFTDKANSENYKNLLNMILKTNKILNPISDWLWEKIIDFKAGVLEINYDALKQQIIQEKNSATKGLQKYTVDMKTAIKEKHILILKFLYTVNLVINGEMKLDARYASVLNLIISEDYRNVYPAIANVEELFELYEKVSKVLAVDVQSMIYRNENYFNKYLTLIDLTTYSSDYRWQQNILDMQKRSGNNSIEIKQKLMEIFADFDYNQEILLED